jgi:hypothetical protein
MVVTLVGDVKEDATTAGEGFAITLTSTVSLGYANYEHMLIIQRCIMRRGEESGKR